MSLMNPLGFVLIVEDNRILAQTTGSFLEHQGYTIDYATDGRSGLNLAMMNEYDVIVLDRNLPVGPSGLELCRNLRQSRKHTTPILMLSGCDAVEDRVSGLDAGADDYLTKPFQAKELEVRLRALIRRERKELSSNVLVVADLVLDMGTLSAYRAGRELKLTPIGRKILKILMRESPKLVYRSSIEREIWGDALPNSDTLRSHMYSLRSEIDKRSSHKLLHTVHSTGYRIADARLEFGA